MNPTTYYKTPEAREQIQGVYDYVLGLWPQPNEKSFIETRHGRTFVVASGSAGGAPLILIHGSGSNSYMWAMDAALYGRSFRVYALDIPGDMGKSEERRPSWDNDDFVEWMADVYAGLGIQTAAIVGISLGGWIGTKWASCFPEKVSNLVLLCPSGFVRPKGSFFFKSGIYALLGDYGLRKTAELVFGARDIDSRVLDYFKLSARGYNFRRGAPPLFADKEVRNLTMPVMLMGGDKDTMLDNVSSIQRIRRLLPRVETRLLKGIGHAVTGVADTIMNFLTA